MQVAKLETIRNAAHPHLLWVRIHSDNGLIGLGETFYLPSAVEVVIHDAFAGFVLGRSVYDLESIWDTGLVTIFANMHICASSTNAMILETVRGYYEGWYRSVYTDNVQIEDGYALFRSTPGLGTKLKADFLADERTSTRITTLPDSYRSAS